MRTTELSFIIKPSAIEGVGVFTTHGITKGTLLRLFPRANVRLWSHAQLAAQPLLADFCIRYGVEDKKGFYVSRDFGRMEIGWYLNHSPRPNAYHDQNYDYFALRDIAAGEEILIDYRKL